MNTFWLGRGTCTFGLGIPYGSLLAAWESSVRFKVFISRRVIGKVNITRSQRFKVTR